jgi:glucose-1-phosphate thymidylyltransferase
VKEIVAVIPAAGLATRLSPLPCSKELLPIGLDSKLRPKVVSQYLLEGLRDAGIRKVFFVLRRGKWDIPGYYSDGTSLGLDLAYLLMRVPFGVPYTLDSAYPFIRGVHVAVGFPDILYEPSDVFSHVRARVEDSDADGVVGVFPAPPPHLCDVVRLDGRGRVEEIVVKPPRSDLKLSWAVVIWSPRFTEFLHEHVTERVPSPEHEVSLGHVIQAGIDAGLVFESVTFEQGRYTDAGTPEGLQQAIQILGR